MDGRTVTATPGVGEAPRDAFELRRLHRRELGHVTDGDASAPAELLGAVADVLDGHAIRGVAEVEVHVDIHVELARHLEQTIDLSRRIAVGVGRAANDVAAPLQALDHELVGSGVVQQTLLRKDADLQIHGPLVLVDQRLDAIQAPQAHHRIHLQVGAHVGGALQDALLQGPHGALAHLLGLEAPLGLRHLGDGLVQRSLDGLAAIEQARLVQVDVGLDEPRRDEASADVDLFALGSESGLDGDDAPALDPDVHRRVVLRAGNQRISENQVHGLLPSASV